MKTNKSADREVSAKELADAAKLPYDTIDHWSGEGLLQFDIVGRKRRYHLRENLRTIKLIRKLQREGTPLKLIRKQLK